MAGKITDGDNFRVIGPWRIDSGSGWREWRYEALVARQHAASANGDEFTVHLLEKKKKSFEAIEGSEGTARVPKTQPPEKR